MKNPETPKLAPSDREEEVIKHRLEVEANLRHFTGTENWYRTIIPNILYTDGVKYLADSCDAHWLVNDIALHQGEKAVRAEEFQVWILRVEKNRGVLSCEDGNYHEVYSTKIPLTDFPFPEFKLYYTNNVILLPSEY